MSPVTDAAVNCRKHTLVNVTATSELTVRFYDQSPAERTVLGQDSRRRHRVTVLLRTGTVEQDRQSRLLCENRLMMRA